MAVFFLMSSVAGQKSEVCLGTKLFRYVSFFFERKLSTMVARDFRAVFEIISEVDRV